MFSRRTHWNTQSSELALAWQQRQASGLPCFDLTVSNPTVAGFEFDLAPIAQALAAGSYAGYSPAPFGLPKAREAVANYYRDDHSAAVALDRIVLTASTSEAYSYLFRLLCDPGDEVLYMQPGYPLFDYLADLDSVSLRPVSWLEDADGWHLDRGGLEQAAGPKTRAVLVVHPNNPTGHYVSDSDHQWLDRWCAERDLALIVDEVFLDYSLGPHWPSFLTKQSDALTFVLSGVSKISGLPQMKAGWVCLHGPDKLVARAAERLEIIADTFLSVSTPLQFALPALLEARHGIRPQILARIHENLATLDEVIVFNPLISRNDAQGGWYTTLRIPAYERSDGSAMRLVRETGVHVHPGDLFGYATSGIWVVGLITPMQTFRQGLGQLSVHVKASSNT